MNLWKAVAALILTAVAAVGVSAQNTKNCLDGKAPKCSDITGRWAFSVTTGDGLAQTAWGADSGFDTYLVQQGSSLTAVAFETYDSSIADQYGVNVAGAGNIHNGSVTITFSKTAGQDGFPTQIAFTETFTGTLNRNINTDGSAYFTITGTYTNTINDASISAGSGSFVATGFPDFVTPTTYTGALEALDNNGNLTGASFPVSYTIATSPTHNLTGTVNATSIIKNGISCFSSEPLTIIDPAPGQPMGESFATGEVIDIFAVDNAGSQLFMEGYSVTPSWQPAAVGAWWTYPTYPTPDNGPFGTNQVYVFLFSVSGGYCDGFEGLDTPFTIVNHHAHSDTAGSNARGRKHGNQ